MLSCVQLFVISWTVAHPALLSMGFSRQEHWIGLPFPLPNPGIKLKSSALQAGSLLSEPPGKPQFIFIYIYTAKHKYKVSLLLALLGLKRNHKENGQCNQETSKATSEVGMVRGATEPASLQRPSLT